MIVFPDDTLRNRRRAAAVSVTADGYIR